MKLLNKKCYVEFTEINRFPPLKTNKNSDIIFLCLKHLKTNSINTVSFGTEAGVFDKLGFQTIVCGPGSIKQAHKPNEFIEMDELLKCNEFLNKVIKSLY